MKRVLTIILGSCLLAVLALAGCGRHRVSTSALQDNFQSAEPAAQDLATNAIAAIKAGNFSEAQDDLQKLTHKAKLDPEQRQAVLDTLSAVEYQLTNTTAAATATSGSSTNSRSFWNWLKSLKH